MKSSKNNTCKCSHDKDIHKKLLGRRTDCTTCNCNSFTPTGKMYEDKFLRIFFFSLSSFFIGLTILTFITIIFFLVQWEYTEEFTKEETDFYKSELTLLILPLLTVGLMAYIFIEQGVKSHNHIYRIDKN